MGGIGVPELIILVTMGVLFCVAPIAVVALIVFPIRNQSTGRMAELQEENRWLRDKLDDRDRTTQPKS